MEDVSEMSGIDASGITISIYSGTDRAGVLELLAHLWKGLDPSEREEKFRWRYEKNPNSSSPLIFVAKHKNRIVGIRAAVAQKFIVHETVFTVYSNADTVIHPDYRRKGLLKRLDEAIQKSNILDRKGIFLNLSSNNETTEANLKNGFFKINADKSIAVKISIINVIRNIILKRNQRWTGDREIQKKGYRIFLNSEPKPKLFEEICISNRTANKCTCLRNVDYFKWRYSLKMDEYWFIHCSDKEGQKGYLILKNLSSNRFFLEEFSAVSFETFNVLISTAFEMLDIGVLQTWMISFQHNDWLKRCSFFKESNLMNKFIGKKRLPLLVRPITPNPAEKDFYIHGLDIRKSNNWLIYHADAH